MAHDNLVIVPRSDLVIQVPPMAQVPAAPLHVAPADAERIQVVDGVFTQNSEDRSALGLLGIWSSVMLLHDLAAEHLAPPVEPDNGRGKLPRPDDEPDADPAD